MQGGPAHLLRIAAEQMTSDLWFEASVNSDRLPQSLWVRESAAARLGGPARLCPEGKVRCWLGRGSVGLPSPDRS